MKNYFYIKNPSRKKKVHEQIIFIFIHNLHQKDAKKAWGPEDVRLPAAGWGASWKRHHPELGSEGCTGVQRVALSRGVRSGIGGQKVRAELSRGKVACRRP